VLPCWTQYAGKGLNTFLVWYQINLCFRGSAGRSIDRSVSVGRLRRTSIFTFIQSTTTARPNRSCKALAPVKPQVSYIIDFKISDLKMSQNASKCLKMSQNVSSWDTITRNTSELNKFSTSLKMSHNTKHTCLKMSQNVSKCFKMSLPRSWISECLTITYLIPIWFRLGAET